MDPMKTFCATYRPEPGFAKRHQEMFAAVSWQVAVEIANERGRLKDYGELVSLELCTVLEPWMEEYKQWSNTKGD